MDVVIEDLNDDARGRGRTPDGRVALVSQAYPGDVVRLAVDRSTRGTHQGRVAEVVRSSAERRSSPCLHENRCTGCPLLMGSDALEARFKRVRLDSLAREAGWSSPEAPRLSRPGASFGYRHFAKRVFAKVRGHTVLGSHVAGTHEVVDNLGCPVLTKPLARVLDRLAELADDRGLPLHEEAGMGRGLRYAIGRTSRLTKESVLTLVLSDPQLVAEVARLASDLRRERPDVRGVTVRLHAAADNILMSGTEVGRSGDSEVAERLLGFEHRIGPDAFFQVNPDAAEVLFSAAVAHLGAHRNETVVETHAGSGALTLPIARRVGSVVAIELSELAVARMVAASVAARLRDRVRPVVGSVPDLLPDILERERPRILVADPPRSGLSRGLAEAISGSSVRRLVLLSCEPASLVTDARNLSGGGFRIRNLLGVDQFPRTAHFETVSVFER